MSFVKNNGSKQCSFKLKNVPINKEFKENKKKKKLPITMGLSNRFSEASEMECNFKIVINNLIIKNNIFILIFY